EEGWREAPGWWRFSSPTTPRRRSRRLCPSFAGGERSPLSPPRRGGVARSAGVVAFQFLHHPSAPVTSPLPRLRRGGALSIFPASSRRGGAKRRGGAALVAPHTPSAAPFLLLGLHVPVDALGDADVLLAAVPELRAGLARR